ncbi:MAG: outer membrane beta-barrel protein [Bacteroidaceae bacterium]|nr:outer membrane beta-barrel protein [Bacteroidaceae bacterium]
MKSLKQYAVRLAMTVALIAGISAPAKSQVSLDAYYNVDWQFNIPSNKFVDKVSGWGMNFDAGWYLTPDIAIGAFMNYHTNNQYVDRAVVHVSDATSIYTDQQRSLYQLPFGLTMLYRIIESDWQPYVAMKLGAEYAYTSSYYNIYKSSEDSWGFYVSPEIGVRWYPLPNGVGLHAAAYYSFSTNKSSVMGAELHNPSNFGFRLGLAF